MPQACADGGARSVDKTAKLKKARDDADLEINNYKQRKNEEFQHIAKTVRTPLSRLARP